MPDLTTYNWNQLFPDTVPAARYYHNMVWDGTRIIMFGGYASGYSAQTWEYAGGDWNLLSPASSPSARIGHGMVWDGSRVLLFGGTASGTFQNDLWEFTGGDWNQLSPATTPDVRADMAMAWDGSRILMHGGLGNFSPTLFRFYRDTWEYTGGDWNLLSPASTPADVRHSSPADRVNGRFAHKMIWNGSDALIYCGCSDTGGSYELPAPSPDPFQETNGGTWAFDGTNWSQPDPATDPLGRFQYPFAVTDDGTKTLMFGGDWSHIGGLGRSFFADTWQHDGTDWTDLEKVGPAARGWAPLVWDDDAERFLMFGGRGGSGTTVFSDTWEFAPDTPPPAEEFVTISHTFGLGR